jgi:MFS family permease
VLATTILASSLAFIDGSVVNVGLPAIGRSLSANAAALQWVINAYLLPLSALLLLGGALGDGFGRRRMLIAGILLFALASLACSVRLLKKGSVPTTSPSARSPGNVANTVSSSLSLLAWTTWSSTRRMRAAACSSLVRMLALL